jgi:peptidoglycan hydrolase CwlO-like protein
MKSYCLKLFSLFFIGLLGLGIFLHLNSPSAVDANEADKLQELARRIEEYAAKIESLQAQAGTLSNQIAQFDAKINLTEAKIQQTQEQILLLGGRIDQLDVSMQKLGEAFTSRVVETYKIARYGDSIVDLATSLNVEDALSRYHYLQKIQAADQELLAKLRNAQTVYIEQKSDLEELEQVLGAQKEELDSQKVAKAHLLNVTKNDEKNYQNLLAAARSEYEAIQSIIAGYGEETEAGQVNTGDRIATVIQGPSCNSSGAHLHLIVREGNSTRNPFEFLKPGIGHENCSGPGCGEGGDPFNPSGTWEWPLSGPIKYSQGYGATWATRNTWVGRIYSFHNGIDINNSADPTVKAVQPGTLYRGSFTGSSGCRLRYVRVDHADSELETFYLHINY